MHVPIKMSHALNGVITTIENDAIIFTKTCTVSNEIYCLKVNRADYDRWVTGSLIQKVFPQLTADEREFMITGFTPSEWNDIFGESE